MAILETYGLHMLHLHPNVVVMLSLFAYACEAYVGVTLSITLFCHFFVPHMGRSRWISGCVSFKLRPEEENQFSTVVVDRSAREWRRNWYSMRTSSVSPHLFVPSAPAERIAHSQRLSSQEVVLTPAILRPSAMSTTLRVPPLLILGPRLGHREEAARMSFVIWGCFP